MRVINQILKSIFGDGVYCSHLTEDGEPWTAHRDGVCPECCNEAGAELLNEGVA